MSIRPRRLVRWSVVAAGTVVGLAVVAHFAPLLVWYGGLADSLRREPAAHRLRSRSLEAFPPAPADWQPWQKGVLRFALPGGAREVRGCDGSGAACYIVLPARSERAEASVSVLPPGHEEPYEEMLDFRAPDERDLSPWRSAVANWATIGALRTFVLTSRSAIDSSRFAHERARGVFVHSEREGRSRWVVAAYAPEGDAARGLAVAGLDEDEFHALLGSLDLQPHGERGR